MRTKVFNDKVISCNSYHKRWHVVYENTTAFSGLQLIRSNDSFHFSFQSCLVDGSNG